MLHEVFHLVCGHIGWLGGPRRKGDLPFDEARVGVAGLVSKKSKRTVASEATSEKIARAYMFEAEADGLAIQWLTRESAFPSADGFSIQGLTFLRRLPKGDRKLAYRLVLGAVWFTLRRMEATRIARMSARSDTHPLPGARTIMAISMLAREYAAISKVEIDERGTAHRVLTAREASRLREFMREVALPVLRADWWPNSRAIPRASLEGSFPELLLALQHYFLLDKPSDIFNQQIRRIEEMRLKMDSELAPYRYFPLALEQLRKEPKHEEGTIRNKHRGRRSHRED